jgi:hypothetical protein
MPAVVTSELETITCEADTRIAKNSEVQMKVLPRGPAANILDAPSRRLYRKTFGPFNEDIYGFSSVEILARRVPVETLGSSDSESQDKLICSRALAVVRGSDGLN